MESDTEGTSSDLLELFLIEGLEECHGTPKES
jgi:hypothetical protein